jgi:hypothetical protein
VSGIFTGIWKHWILTIVSSPFRFRVRALGFKQFSLRHVIRVSADVLIDGFSTSRLSEHAIFPLGFRRKVGSVTQGYHAQPLPCYTGIIQTVMQRTSP